MTEEVLVVLLAEHSREIDLRKVDCLWFMDPIAAYLQRGGRESMHSSGPIGGA
jgi:hypothetical protein